MPTEICLHHIISDQAVALHGWTMFWANREQNYSWTRRGCHNHNVIAIILPLFTFSLTQDAIHVHVYLYINNCIYVIYVAQRSLWTSILCCIMMIKLTWTMAMSFKNKNKLFLCRNNFHSLRDETILDTKRWKYWVTHLCVNTYQFYNEKLISLVWIQGFSPFVCGTSSC